MIKQKENANCFKLSPYQTCICKVWATIGMILFTTTLIITSRIKFTIGAGVTLPSGLISNSKEEACHCKPTILKQL